MEPSLKPSLHPKNFFQTLVQCCHTSGLTLQEGGCSGLEKAADGSLHWTDPDGTQRSLSHIQNVHLKEEVFLFGNLLSAIVCCVYLTRGLFGLLAGVLSFSYAWKKVPTFQQWTRDLTNVPSYALKIIPLIGNVYAAKLNKQACVHVPLSLPAPLPEPIQVHTPPPSFPPNKTSPVSTDAPSIPEKNLTIPLQTEFVSIQKAPPDSATTMKSTLEKTPYPVFPESDTTLQTKILSLKKGLVETLKSFTEIVDFGPKRDRCVQDITSHLQQYLFHLPHTELLQLEADRLDRRPVKIPSIDSSLVIPEDLARPIILKEVLRRASPTEYLEELLGYSPELLSALQKNGCRDAYGRLFDKETIQLAQILQSTQQHDVSKMSLSDQIRDHESAKKFLQDHLSTFKSEVSFFSPPPTPQSIPSKSAPLDPSVFFFERTLGVQYDIQRAATSGDPSILEVYGVASQANLSENTVPQPIPLGRGVKTYSNDPTQGPMAQLCFHQPQVELLAAAGNLGFNSLINVLDESTKEMVQHGYCQPSSDKDCTKICEQVKTKKDKIEYACVTSIPKGGSQPVSLLFGFAPCFVDTTTCAMSPISPKLREDLSYHVALHTFRAQLAQVVKLADSHPSKKIIFKPTGLGLGVFQNTPKAIEQAYVEACREFTPKLKLHKVEVRWQVHCPLQKDSSGKYTYPLDEGMPACAIAHRLGLQESPRDLDSLAQEIHKKTEKNKNTNTNIFVEQLSDSIDWTSDQVKEMIQNSKQIAQKISSDCADKFTSAFFSITSGMKKVEILCKNGVLGSALEKFCSALPVILPIPAGFGSTFSHTVLLACHNRAKVFLKKSFQSFGTAIDFYSPPSPASGCTLPEYQKDFASKDRSKLDSRVFTVSKIARIQDAIHTDEGQTSHEIIAYGLDNQWNGFPSPHRRPVAIGEGTTILSSPRTAPGAQALSTLPPELTEALNLGAHLGFNSLMPILDNNTKTSTSYGYFTPNTPDKFQTILKKCKEGGGKIEYLSIRRPSTDKTKNLHFLFTGLPAWGEYALDKRITPEQEKELSYYVALAGFRAQFAQISHLASSQKKPATLKLSESNLLLLGQDPAVILQAYYQASLEFSACFLENRVKVQWFCTEETALTEQIKKMISSPESVEGTLPTAPLSPVLQKSIPLPAAAKEEPKPATFPITKAHLTTLLNHCAQKFASYSSTPKIVDFIKQSIALDSSKTTIDILPIPGQFNIEATIEQQRACHEKAKLFLQQSLPVMGSTLQCVSPPQKPIQPYQQHWILPKEPLDASVFSWERTRGVLQDIQKDATRPEETLVLYGAASQFNGSEAMDQTTYPPGQAHTLYQYDMTQGPQAQLAFAKEQVELINIGANLGWNGLCHVLDDTTKSALQHGYLTPIDQASCNQLIQQCQERGHLAEFPCIEGFPQGTTKKSVHLMLVAAPALGIYLPHSIPQETQNALVYFIATICWRAQFHQALQLAKTSGKPVIFKPAGVGLGVFGNEPRAVAQAYYHVCQEFVEEFKKHQVSVRWQLFGESLINPSGKVIQHLQLKKFSKQ